MTPQKTKQQQQQNKQKTNKQHPTKTRQQQQQLRDAATVPADFVSPGIEDRALQTRRTSL